MKKLQLELIPYCSGEFQNKELIRLYPYVDTLFDEIFSMARKYIIFSSVIFEKLFKNKAEMAKIGAKVTFGPKQYPDPSHPILKKDGKPTSTRFNCTRIKIDYNGKGKIAMIAPTFFKKRNCRRGFVPIRRVLLQ